MNLNLNEFWPKPKWMKFWFSFEFFNSKTSHFCDFVIPDVVSKSRFRGLPDVKIQQKIANWKAESLNFSVSKELAPEDASISRYGRFEYACRIQYSVNILRLDAKFKKTNSLGWFLMQNWVKREFEFEGSIQVLKLENTIDLFLWILNELNIQFVKNEWNE